MVGGERERGRAGGNSKSREEEGEMVNAERSAET